MAMKPRQILRMASGTMTLPSVSRERRVNAVRGESGVIAGDGSFSNMVACKAAAERPVPCSKKEKGLRGGADGVGLAGEGN